ncbi:MAG TPA: hypothetical protein VFD01_18250 [Candidatus Dormibacteraeota bacterium]|nr:hypothetical protein [Candidatus Dormibacteraeota bacterium]
MGVDWAEGFQLVALGTPDQGIMEVLRVEHRPQAVAQLLARIAALEPDPAELRVVIETRHGLLVEAFWEAGFTVLPVNPELIARRPGPQEGRCRGRPHRLPGWPRPLRQAQAAHPPRRAGQRAARHRPRR